MGSGKGNVEEWAAVIKPGRIIFEMQGVTKAEAYEALRLANNKLPVKCKPMSKESESLAQAALLAKRQAKAAKKAATKRMKPSMPVRRRASIKEFSTPVESASSIRSGVIDVGSGRKVKTGMLGDARVIEAGAAANPILGLAAE